MASIKKNTHLPPPEHPQIVKARQLAAEGNTVEAANLIDDLGSKVDPGPERGKLFALGAQFIKTIDQKKALAFASKAIKEGPKQPECWLALSFVYGEMRDHPASTSAALRLFDLDTPPEMLVDLGRHLSRYGEDALALKAVKKGYLQGKGPHLHLASYTLRVALQCADWELSEKITHTLLEAHKRGDTEKVAETPRTHLLWCQDEAINIKVLTNFAKSNFKERPAIKLAPRTTPLNKPIHIAYLSSDYRDHATSLLALGMMRYHDKTKFKISAYCTSYDDGSALRRDMLNRFDVAKTVAKMTDKDAALVIAQDEVDVLIDLNGLTEGTRHGILSYRPAPVQIAYLGFPGTVGGRYIDYVIADDYTIPNGVENLYPEKIIRIPPTYQINDYSARFLPPPSTKSANKLPPDKLIIGMFNNINKVGPVVWDTWMKILSGFSESILWIMDPGKIAAEALINRAEAAGIDPNRISFAPKKNQEDHIARLRLCDLVLDPWPYGGHTTTADALFAGVPVIALEGTNFASRVSGGLLKSAGLSQFIYPSRDLYIEGAINLLKQPNEILKIKRYLISQRFQLEVFNARNRTLQLEAAYTEAYMRHLKNIPPQHFSVNIDNKAKDKPESI